MRQITQKPIDYLTPEKAAAKAGMTRPAFLKYVEKGDIKPDVVSGKRILFLPDTVRRWVAARRKNGAKKRGYPAKQPKTTQQEV